MDEKPSVPGRDRERDPRTGRDAAQERVRQQSTWVDLQIQQAMARGEFDDLPGFGKPIEDLGSEHDPNWWIRKLVEREQIAGVLPPALQVRKDDAELDGVLDELTSEAAVRREVEEFNDRVRRALYQPTGGPPMITRQRDVEVEVERWRERRRERREAEQRALAGSGGQESRPTRPPGRRLSRWIRRAVGRPASP